MSKVDKMNILGIRSFPNQKGETIAFYTPLTLICGSNGSGKTTIVECLKYATSGIQPPNSKGGAFVHDPKLTGEREVMASVKLQFKSAKGARMVVTRSLQLTMKKATPSLKTLEGSLLIEHRGEKTIVSSRAGELDATVPQYLGVSPAVLDNIIFCHQDESLWPMSEPSTLKKKFDEIFEAQKYTKAVDNIKNIRKKHQDELGKYKILEQHAKEDRDRAEKARKKSEELSNSIEQLREECLDLQSKMDEAQALANRLWKDSEEYSRILGTLEGKQIQARARRDNIESLRDRLQEVPQSDEWLERNLAQFDAAIAKHEQQQQDKKEQWLEWKNEIKNLNEKMSIKLGEKFKYEQEKEEYEGRLSQRAQMVKDAASKHELRGFDDSGEEVHVEHFIRKITKLAKERTTYLESSRVEADNEKQKSLNLVNRLTARCVALQDNKSTVRSQIAENDREASDYQRRVDAIKVDEGSQAIIDSRIEDINSKLQAAKEIAQSSNWESKLKDATTRLHAEESEFTRLNAEMMQASKRADEVARLAILKENAKEKQRSLDGLFSAHKDRINGLIGSDWTAGNVEQVHGVAVSEAVEAVKEAEKARDAENREVDQIQFKQKTVRGELAQKKAQAAEYEKTVTKVIATNIAEYDDILAQVTENVTRARDQAKGTEGLLDYFTKCLENFDADKPSCRLCHRGFKNAEDPNLIVAKKRITALIEKASKKIGEAEVKQTEAAYKAVTDAGIPLANWKKLTIQEIPALESSLVELNNQKKSAITRLESKDKAVHQKQAARREMESISSNISSITKNAADITSTNKQIDTLLSQQSQQGNDQTLEDIQDKMSALTETIGVLKQTITSITTEQSSSREQLHDWELKLRDLKNELSTSVSQLEKKAALAARVREFTNSNQKYYDSIEKAEQDIQLLEPQVTTAKMELDDSVQRWTNRLADLNREVTQLTDTRNEIGVISDQIASYVDRGGDQRLTVVLQEIQNLKKEIEQADDTQVQLGREINEIQEILSNNETTKTKYENNLMFRRDTRALEQLEDEISELAARNAHVDRDRFQAKSKQATSMYQQYFADKEGLLGQMKTKDNQLAEILQDYDTDFKDAPRRYKEAHIKVETTKAAVSDLQVYGSALDSAIMKFHSLRMEQINEIIAHLWQKTYKGSDVDSILIRSNHEGAANTSTTGTRARSYNYRVVMVKQGVEMDMRGRCSAGQKVLASIIIRLALADVFSQDCGLIALDEPTTNLDYDNIISLAHALHEIIKERQKQSNFQLIVITHDEEFLRAINPGAFCDFYYRVSRDRNADSIIEKQRISDV